MKPESSGRKVENIRIFHGGEERSSTKNSTIWMMVSVPSIAAVSYLNTIPFIYGIRHEGNFRADLLLSPPSECTKTTSKGVPIWRCFRLPPFLAQIDGCDYRILHRSRRPRANRRAVERRPGFRGSARLSRSPLPDLRATGRLSGRPSLENRSRMVLSG